MVSHGDHGVPDTCTMYQGHHGYHKDPYHKDTTDTTRTPWIQLSSQHLATYLCLSTLHDSTIQLLTNNAQRAVLCPSKPPDNKPCILLQAPLRALEQYIWNSSACLWSSYTNNGITSQLQFWSYDRLEVSRHTELYYMENACDLVAMSAAVHIRKCTHCNQDTRTMYMPCKQKHC